MIGRNRDGAGIAALALALIAGCGRGELVAGPADVGPSPVELTFRSPVTVAAPANEIAFCVEFDRPSDSADAIGLEIVLVTSEGKREPFHGKADRVGERDVCWRGKTTSTPPVVYRAIEIKSAIPARVREIRFVPD